MHPLGTLGAIDEERLGAFVERLEGDVVTPDAGAYDGARDVWNGLVNRYPALIAQVEHSEDVAMAVAFARENELPLSVRGGAHEQSGSAVVDNGLVIDLRRLDHVDVDPDRRVASVGPGNSTADALAATQEHGLAFPTGSAGSPGLSGTTLGGGIGWIRRNHGLAVDALRRVELVTADGQVRTASVDTNPDLFWAVRGGGGNFGVVTDLEFDLSAVGPTVGGLSVFYPRSDADEVVAAFRDFVSTAPAEATAICNYTEIPAVPGMPPALHGEEAIALIGCYAGDTEAGLATFEPLREVTDPLVDNSGPVPYEMLHELGTMLHPWGRKYVHRSVYVDDLTDDLHALLLDQTEAAPGPMDGVGVWPLGGAIEDGPDSAYAWRDKAHLVVVEAAWESPDSPAHLSWARETERRLREAGGEGAYAGYVGVEEQPWEDWAEQVYGDNYDRLRALKREYDPENVFRHGVGIEPVDS